MKKIQAFVTALLLFTVFTVFAHFVCIQALPKNDRDFGYWISYNKDASFQAISRNITEDTMLYMGSSEFHHGLHHDYNPANLFKRSQLNLMCMGGAFNQSLSHAIAAGAFGPQLTKKKAALILSPTWFYSGDDREANKFLLRYSEGEYNALMNNDNISNETKAKLTKRVESLLGDVSHKDQLKVIKHLSAYIKSEKDRNKCAMTWMAIKKKAKQRSENSQVSNSPENPGAGGEVLDFDALKKEAGEKCAGRCTNEFNMKDSVFNKKFAGSLESKKNCNARKNFEKSNEYGDLQLFIDICKEQDIEVLLILQPINGKWYDYTGLTTEKRQVVYKKIRDIAKENKVQLADLSGEEYTEDFFEDAVHPTEKGWVLINEKAYEFFKQ